MKLNQRIIKFRVWDKLRKSFFYPDEGYQGHFILTLNGKFYNLQNGSGGDEYNIQQFTGLKDINNKEIYEGDILLRTWWRNDGVMRGDFLGKMETDTKIVKWDNYNGFDFKFQEFPMGWMWEVIGNVCENPELYKI